MSARFDSVAGVSTTHADEVVSGEAIGIDVQPLGFLLRALGALIDIAFALALVVAALLLQVWLESRGLLDDATARILTISTLVVCLVLVPCALETVLRGRSLGKLAVGGRIVRSDGGATGFRHAFIRAMAGVLEVWLTLGAVAFITGVFTARAQRLGDLLAGTYAQRVRLPRLENVPTEMPAVLSGWAQTADVARLPDRLARRIAQFLNSAPQLTTAARERIAADLAAEAAAAVSPWPPVPPEEALRGISVARRLRESEALRRADARAEALLGSR